MKSKTALLILLSLTGFVTSFGAYIVASNLPAYSKETGAGLVIIGLLIALYDLAEIFVKPFGALLSRKTSEWAVLRIGLLLFSLASGMYLILAPEWLILVRLLQGAGAAFFSVMSMTLLVRYFSDRKGMALGLYGAFKNSGYVLAPTIGGVFVYYQGFGSVFALCLMVGILVLFLSFLLRPARSLDSSSEASKRRKRNPALKDLVASLKDRRMFPVFGIMFFNMIFMAAFFGFMPVLLSLKGLDPVGAGLILAVNAAFYLATQPLSGRLSDTVGRKRVIGFGLLVSTLCISVLSFLDSPYYILAACLLAVGIGCVAPLGEALVGDVSNEDNLAINLGLAGSYKELGEMAGPLLLGFVGQTIGLEYAFLMVGAAGIGSLACLGMLKEKGRVIESAPLT
jgi:MFS family permease